jgi:hypothetical protein
MNPPNGLAELEARYGRLILGPDPRGGLRIISPIGWETAHMMPMTDLPGLPGRKLYVNRDLVGPLTAALMSVAVLCPTYKIKTIGCWNVRYKRTQTKQISVHAFGLAVDINAAQNPLSPTLITDMPGEFVAAFKREGFTWGGEFSGTKDAMHMQWCSNY